MRMFGRLVTASAMSSARQAALRGLTHAPAV